MTDQNTLPPKTDRMLRAREVMNERRERERAGRLAQMREDTGLANWLANYRCKDGYFRRARDLAGALHLNPVIFSVTRVGTQRQLLPARVVEFINALKADEGRAEAFVSALPPVVKKEKAVRVPKARVYASEAEKNLNTKIINLFRIRFNMTGLTCAKALYIEPSNYYAMLTGNHKYPSHKVITKASQYSGNFSSATGRFDHMQMVGFPIVPFLKFTRLKTFDNLRPHFDLGDGKLNQWAMRGVFDYHKEAVAALIQDGKAFDFVMAAARAEDVWVNSANRHEPDWKLSPLYYAKRLEAEALLLPYVTEDYEPWRWNASGIDISPDRPASVLDLDYDPFATNPDLIVENNC